ncbi:hypothetical protein [Methylobacterium mesophilicum]
MPRKQLGKAASAATDLMTRSDVLGLYVQSLGTSGYQKLPSGATLCWGQATTDTTGAWTFDLTAAGFTVIPQILAQAISADTTLGTSASATVTARSKTTASGYVNLPNVIAIGGMPVKRSGSGLIVSVYAIGV